MSCKNCKYRGMYIKHLDDYDPDSIDLKRTGARWYNCTYPLPFHAKPKAIMEHWGESCRVFEKTDI